MPKLSRKVRGLNPRQALFVSHYLADPKRNGTQAAIRAGYSERTARSIASELLTQPDVKAAVDAAYERQLARLDHKAERVNQELARIAFFDPGQLYDDRGKLLPIYLLDEDTRRALAGFKAPKGRGTRYEYTPADKLEALQYLARINKQFTNTIELGGINLAEAVTKAREAAGIK